MGAQGKQSRAGLFAGLAPNQWIVLFQKEDPTEDPVFNYRGIDLHVQADHLNTAVTEYIVQDSVDGINWTNRLVGAAPIVPGGEVALGVYFSGRYVRVLVYSAGVGRVDATLAIPEDDVVPGLWPDVGTLTCASYCEVSAES
jgi:hypothetical protein